MQKTHQVPRPLDPQATGLSGADDRIRLNRWLPPQEGVAPRIRIAGRWINVLWAIPLTVALLILAVAVAQQLRTVPSVQEFIARYPGGTPASRGPFGLPSVVTLAALLQFLLP